MYAQIILIALACHLLISFQTMNSLKDIVRSVKERPRRSVLILEPINFEHRFHASYIVDKCLFEGLPPQWRSLIDTCPYYPRRQGMASPEQSVDLEAVLRFLEEFKTDSPSKICYWFVTDYYLDLLFGNRMFYRKTI